jgi:Asp-tRNA(Asn)/Glu-tRNA(Gln) amidotransferase C subunit
MTKDSADHLRRLAGMEAMRKELEKMEATISQLEQLVGTLQNENEKKSLSNRILTLKTIADIRRHSLAAMESKEQTLEP